MMMNRRGILLGLASALAAQAIVHAGNLMPVKALPALTPMESLWAEIYKYEHFEVSLGYSITRKAISDSLDARMYSNFPGFKV